MNEKRIKRVQGYSKVTPRGATRPAARWLLSEQARRWLRRGFVISILAAGCGLIYHLGADPLSGWLQRPIASVQVEGEFRYISKERTMDIISAEINRDFLQLNLTQLKQVLEREAWIEHAAVGRRWPDRLEVRISEQKPIARWGEKGFLNQRGEIIHVQQADQLTGLPWLQGADSDAKRVMQQYQDIAQLLRTRGLDISALHNDEKKAWRLTLKNGVTIAIGRDQVMEKIWRFLTVYDQYLMKYWADVKAVDVRYSNGVAVQWHPEVNT